MLARGYSASASCNVKVAPCSRPALTAVSKPPCNLANRLAIASPRLSPPLGRCQSAAELSGLITRNANCMAAAQRSASKPAR